MTFLSGAYKGFAAPRLKRHFFAPLEMSQRKAGMIAASLSQDSFLVRLRRLLSRPGLTTSTVARSAQAGGRGGESG